MPVHVNKIGEFQFLDIQGVFALRQEQIELLARHGVAGTGFRKTGSRGEPFSVTSVNYVASFATAKTELESYLALAAEDPVEVIRHSVTLGNFKVTMVRERTLHAIINSLGGLNGGEQVYHEVDWQLVNM